ncbi:MAG: tRNA(Ile)(2)-agmatinylcytidine synthase [Haloarculaceae archaeon]
MTIIGLDDTDSRTSGGCTTYLAARLAREVETAGGTVERTLLVRLNPAVEHKTRGNAALAVHCDLEPETALDLAADAVTDAETDDPQTNPGAVVADALPPADHGADSGELSDSIADFSRRAVGGILDPETARETIESEGFATREAGNGRGLVGALAAVGAWRATEHWTYETIAYRERERWGTPRRVDRDSVFEAAAAGYPTVWDTVDRVERTAVCVPRTPGPLLHGIRGDDPAAVEAVSAGIESEPVTLRHTFVTNQGTDAHLQDGTLGSLRDGRSYRVDGSVVEAPETREGGHVFFGLGPAKALEREEPGTIAGNGGEIAAEEEAIRRCVAFEPTKRFRDRVRALRPGDRVTACGEVGEETLKLEKFAVRDLVETEPTTPTCPDCGRSMESAGADQGNRCRSCGRSADGPAERRLDRDLEVGWYEVPPVARRHVAKPLVRGGFDAPVHPER